MFDVFPQRSVGGLRQKQAWPLRLFTLVLPERKASRVPDRRGQRSAAKRLFQLSHLEAGLPLCQTMRCDEMSDIFPLCEDCLGRLLHYCVGLAQLLAFRKMWVVLGLGYRMRCGARCK